MANRPDTLTPEDLQALARIVRDIRDAWHDFAPRLISDLFQVMELTAEERRQVLRLADQKPG